MRNIKHLTPWGILLVVLVVGFAIVGPVSMRRDELSIYNIYDFGARPNDNVADNVAIKNAIDAASTNAGGAIVLFPQGEWTLGAMDLEPGFTSESHPNLINIRSNNITLRGNGYHRTTIKIQSTNYAGSVFNGLGGGESPSAHGPTNLVIEGIKFDGNDAGQDYCYDFTQFYNCNDTIIQDCFFTDIQEDAIDFHNNMTVRRCIFKNVGNGIGSGSGATTRGFFVDCVSTNGGWKGVDGSEMLGVSGGTLVVQNCVFHGGSGNIGVRNGTFVADTTVFYFTNAAGTNFFNENSQSIYLRNCEISRPSANSTPVFRMNGGELHVANSRFLNTYLFAVTNISTLQFLGNRVSAPMSPFAYINGINSAGFGVNIDNNTFFGSSSDGILIPALNRSDSGKVRGNTFYQCDLSFYGNTSTNWLIEGNSFEYNGGIWIVGAAGGPAYNTYHHIVNNNFREAATHLDVATLRNFIIGNKLSQWNLHSFSLGGYNNSFVGNVMSQVAGGTAGYTNYQWFQANMNSDGSPYEPRYEVSLTADNQVVDAAYLQSYYFLSDSTAANRDFILTSGRDKVVIGLIWGDATDGGQLIDNSANSGAGNVLLSADWIPGFGDTLILKGQGTNWVEVSRSNN